MLRKTKLLRLANAGRLVTYLIALWKLFRHPHTPPVARLVALAVLAYTVSPIDLIPDVIPVLGQLDDLVVIPLGVALASRLTPQPLWHALLADADRTRARLPRLGWMIAAVLLAWLLLVAGFAWWLLHAIWGA